MLVPEISTNGLPAVNDSGESNLLAVIYDGEYKLCLFFNMVALQIVRSVELVTKLFAEHSPSSLLAESRCSPYRYGGEFVTPRIVWRGESLFIVEIPF